MYRAAPPEEGAMCRLDYCKCLVFTRPFTPPFLAPLRLLAAPEQLEFVDGSKFFTLVDCYHPAIGRIQRCYDYSTSDFPPPTASGHPVSREVSGAKRPEEL